MIAVWLVGAVSERAPVTHRPVGAGERGVVWTMAALRSGDPGLRLARDLLLPLEAVTQTFAILAKRGVGKTYTASVLVEELLTAGLHVCVVDPIGVWWGLRASADGTAPGLPIIVLGGEHGDVPLEVTAGEIIADFVIDEGQGERARRGRGRRAPAAPSPLPGAVVRQQRGLSSGGVGPRLRPRLSGRPGRVTLLVTPRCWRWICPRGARRVPSTERRQPRSAVAPACAAPRETWRWN